MIGFILFKKKESSRIVPDDSFYNHQNNYTIINSNNNNIEDPYRLSDNVSSSTDSISSFKPYTYATVYKYQIIHDKDILIF